MKNIKPKLIIDTDPGHDDALALMLVLLSQRFDVLAVTTVAGNATIEKVTRNAQAILNVVGSPVPVFSGLPAPIKRKLITAVVHGESGLAGFDTTQTKVNLSEDAPEQICQLVEMFPGEVSILALGPLSNIARAFEQDATCAGKVKQLVIMGGAIDVPGNKNRVAEFNFFVDPEAADIVMQSAVSKVLVPLDACNEVVLQVEDFEKVQNGELQSILIPMMQHFVAGLTSNEGTSGILVYDALAAFFLLCPQAFSLQQMNVVIETRGEHTFGMSVAEKRTYKNEEANVDVVVGIDDARFRQDFFHILSRKK